MPDSPPRENNILRFYDKWECDENGIPLDLERCRRCEGTGEEPHLPPTIKGAPCTDCSGHGSLKAAALDHLFSKAVVADASRVAREGFPRCEGCAHPMSDGAWDPTGDGPHQQALWTRYAFHTLQKGEEPSDKGMLDFCTSWRVYYEGFSIHYSRCDEKCDHGGYYRWCDSEGQWVQAYGTITCSPPGGGPVEASWRPVDVRLLSWAHDLRPERIAILCLRCYVERLKELYE